MVVKLYIKVKLIIFANEEQRNEIVYPTCTKSVTITETS